MLVRNIESPIREYLRTWPKETIHFVPNPGNFGDSLITTATCALFRAEGIEFTIHRASAPFEAAGKVVVYGGGGNLVEYYRSARNVLLQTHAVAKRCILLPHTLSANEDLLGQLGPNVDLICRERVSYEHAARFAPRANVLLMDDLAFSLDAARLLQEGAAAPPGELGSYAARDLFKVPLVRLKQSLGRLLEGGTPGSLNAFRRDREAVRMSYPRDNVDLGTLFGYGSGTEALARYVSWRVLTILAGHALVRTNRLHIAIGAALLGKQVELFPNSYFKCEAVYRFSMQERFPNVHWMG